VQVLVDTIYLADIMNDKQVKTDISDELIMSHLGYVEGLAKQRIKYYFPVELDDLIQAGRLGLIEAARRFNPQKSKKKSIKFSTYAFNWINKYMVEEYLRARFPIHIPEKKLRKLNASNRIYHTLERELVREPKYDELVSRIKAKLCITVKEAEEVTRILALGERIYSLDQTIADDSDTTFADTLESPYRVEDTLDDLLPEELSGVLSTLTPFEKRILEVRFGIGTGQASSFEKIAQEYNVSKETIRRKEIKAFRKLRHPSRSRKLKEFIE
jgi:RNA polymerase primary sigma factor